MSNAVGTPRINIRERLPDGYKAMYLLKKAVHESGLDPKLIELVNVRASQINKCAYCINFHTAEARKLGETGQRLSLLPAFEEACCYSEAEKAALQLAEVVTELPAQGVPEAVIERLRRFYDDTRIAQLVFAAVLINGWNRLMVADQVPVPVEGRPAGQPA